MDRSAVEHYRIWPTMIDISSSSILGSKLWETLPTFLARQLVHVLQVGGLEDVFSTRFEWFCRIIDVS